MEESNKLTMTHTILYSKGWYKRNHKRYGIHHNAICWEDIIKTLTADGYIVRNKKECLQVLNYVISNTSLIKQTSNLQFLEDISPNRCHMIGYYTKDYKHRLYYEEYVDYNQDDAVCYFFLSKLRHLCKDKWVAKAPKKGVLPFKYKKGRPKGWLLNVFGDCMTEYKNALGK